MSSLTKKKMRYFINRYADLSLKGRKQDKEKKHEYMVR